ncbi:MAG: tetraacyldisaccharide 4'-kinase [Bacteroidaceae bacterium]|nr:tetraacyldisaccharide 4'-kinase [Bacteroidaceae bacterium]
MEGDHIKICKALLPFSWLYGMAVNLRNVLFDSGVLPSERFDIPVICVGNITAGGTGKTPHTEYLIRLLAAQNQVAVLSRGYKRKSKGYILARDDMPMKMIGDEPYQMKHKFPRIHMAVDKDRREGIRRLCDKKVWPATDVVLLDDAYQHRYVQAGINILLMDYHRLIYFDELLPAGRLREPRSSTQRADVVIVTKCPTYITPMEEHGIARSLGMQPWQKLFFTHFKYGALHNIKDGSEIELDDLRGEQYNVVLLTGIASPQQMEYDLKKYCNFTSIHFSDHHNFTDKDIQRVKDTIQKVKASGKKTIVITTEKDATRLRDNKTSLVEGMDVYALPIEVEFLDERGNEFDQLILNYVQTNSRNSDLQKKPDDNKA